MLIKIWLEVGMEEQEKRFKARIDGSASPVEAEPDGPRVVRRWYDFSAARDLMLEATDSKQSPWHILRSDDKKRARLNGISHILSQIPYKRVDRDKVKLPSRSDKHKYDDRASIAGRRRATQRY